MKITNIAIEEIKPADYNPRTIDSGVMERLVENLREFGLVDPLIINADMTLIGGHQRLKALKTLGHDHAPCVVLNLDKNREKLLNVALNKISGEFDKDGLRSLLTSLDDSLLDLSLTGFDLLDLDKLILPAAPPQLQEWQFDETYEPFWVVIRGPIDHLAVLKQAIANLDLENCVVEYSA
jgi:ParB family chromosome partitioning protein